MIETGEGDEVLGRDVLEDVSDLEGAEWEGLNNEFDLKVADLSWPVFGVGLELLAGLLDKTRDSLKLHHFEYFEICFT